MGNQGQREAAGKQAMAAEASKRAADSSDQLLAPATTPAHPDDNEMEVVLYDSQEQNDRDKVKDAYVSDSDLSQKVLAEEIKNLVEKSVEKKVKRRTTNKRKRNTDQALVYHGGGPEDDTKSYSRCSVPYLYSVLKAIVCCEHRKNLVKKMGFHYILELNDCYVPRAFAQWIADNSLPDQEIIKIGQKSIPLNAKSFVDVLGIPEGEMPVETDEEAGKIGFLGLFGLSDVPTIKFFGDKIINEKDLSDEEFSRCFMSVFLGTFLCPNSCNRPSTKYMGALIDVDKIKDRNWAKFAHEWFICYLRKYLKERSKHKKHVVTLGGCIYHAAVRYLDFVDFGSVRLPRTLPRICVWKGKLIEHFSEMDKGSDGNYGANRLKDFSNTCYGFAEIMSSIMGPNHSMFKEQIDKVVGGYFSEELGHDLHPELYDLVQEGRNNVR